MNNLSNVSITSPLDNNILVYNSSSSNWVNDNSFTGNVTGNLNGNIEKTSGNLDISAADISFNATNDIQMNASDISLNASGNIEIDVSQNIVIAPQNGIIDLNGHTFARNNVIQQGMIIDYVGGSVASHDLSTNDILFGFTHICSSSSAMNLSVPSLSDVKSAVTSTTGISSLSAGTTFPLSYIVNTVTKNIDLSINEASPQNTVIYYQGNSSFNPSLSKGTYSVQYVITHNDTSAAIIITSS